MALVLATMMIPSLPTEGELQAARNTFSRATNQFRLRMSEFRSRPHLFNVTRDLAQWTGLSHAELVTRLERNDVHSIDAEHAFWNPQSAAELRWQYSASINYLWNTAAHPASAELLDRIVRDPEGRLPVVDFSGGVGNNNLYLAYKGVASVYTGIGILEFSFMQWRVRKHGFENLIELVPPYHPQRMSMDPLAAFAPPRRFGTILALDVLEHIPHYERTVRAMVTALKPGGRICEASPFSAAPDKKQKDTSTAGQDLRIHVSNGGISMEQAMGPMMVRENPGLFACWLKQAS